MNIKLKNGNWIWAEATTDGYSWNGFLMVNPYGIVEDNRVKEYWVITC